jgi:hypothetical protein
MTVFKPEEKKSENMATNTTNKTKNRYLDNVQLLSNSQRNWVLLAVRTNLCIWQEKYLKFLDLLRQEAWKNMTSTDLSQ